VTRLCHDTNGGATGVPSGLRPQIPFLPLVKHSSEELNVFRTLARVPERSKYRKAACRPDAKWSAAAGRPTSLHLNRNSSPVRFSAVSNGHFPHPPSKQVSLQSCLPQHTIGAVAGTKHTLMPRERDREIDTASPFAAARHMVATKPGRYVYFVFLVQNFELRKPQLG